MTADRWQEALFDVPPSPDENLISLPTLFTGRNNAFLYRANLRRILLQARPDVLHIEQEPVSLVMVQWLFAARGLPIKITFFIWENLARRLSPLQRWIEGLTLNQAKGCIAGNTEAANLLRAKGFSGKIVVSPILGIDSTKSHSEPRSGKGKFTVGFVGRLVREKGIRVLNEAVRGLDARLLAVGKGPESVNGEVTGGVRPEQVNDYLRQMDVLVLPSLTTPKWKEQFGRVLIEAMACGLPVIGSNSGAIPETIGDTGLIVPEGDVAALRAAIVRLKDDAKLRAELSRRGLERVKRWSHETIAKELMGLWQSI
ncbi:MAG: glycosyltransferase family 4 protein [Chloroflexi bacterium]|nr:glycosyltransferase family 4 protein [Chloroflexota bacterium]